MIVQNINKQKQINEIIQRFTNRHLFKRFYFIPVFICAFLCSLKVRWRSKKEKEELQPSLFQNVLPLQREAPLFPCKIRDCSVEPPIAMNTLNSLNIFYITMN